MNHEKIPAKAGDSATAEIRPGDTGAAQANTEMERRFYGRTEGETPAEAVDVAELFRNES
ncbi:hypothetical protein [Paenibacillus sp.]|uniref:hypothetical protein n=1 Tax=Paenibacillus sp. TaxID=58172 RepID=UPI002811BABB|nr:hypothetical protein [Paenibacillus sp.]